jgi:hypothetical protein
MLRTTILAVAMITTLTTAALVSSPASAFSFGRGAHSASDDWELHLGRSVRGFASHGFQCCRKHPT